MVLKGIMKLPASVSINQSIDIYKRLADTNLVIGKTDSLIQSSIVNDSLLSLLSFNESVQSTRIEGTQVTFHSFMENKSKKELDWHNREVANYHEALMYGVSQIKDRSRNFRFKNMVFSADTQFIKKLKQIIVNLRIIC